MKSEEGVWRGGISLLPAACHPSGLLRRTTVWHVPAMVPPKGQIGGTTETLPGTVRAESGEWAGAKAPGELPVRPRTAGTIPVPFRPGPLMRASHPSSRSIS